MPLTRCTTGGVSGWKWGNAGKCYTGSDAKRKAIRQGLAEGGGVLKGSNAEVLDFETARLGRLRKRARVG